MINQHYSPLRYPGGKASLYDFLKNTLAANNIVDGVYAECYAGGAGAALKLLLLEDVNRIFLNDKDVLVYKFWVSVLDYTDDLLRMIRDTKPTMHEWSKRKEILKNTDIQKNISDIELGFTAFFLNRCNRSGIFKAGVIGGNDQSGNWKIDARYNATELTKRIELISLYRDRIHLSNNDAISFLKKMDKMGFGKDELLVYLDPPYVIQGKELYRHFYTEQQHINLATYLQTQANLNWVLSYDDHPLIHTLFNNSEKNIFEFNYYANKTKIGNELIIKSPSCKLASSYLHYSKKKKLAVCIESPHRKAV